MQRILKSHSRALIEGARGLTLLELVIAILVLSIATLSTFRTIDRTGAQLGQETARILAQVVAVNRAEELRLARMTDAGSAAPRVQIGRHGFSIDTEFDVTAGGLGRATITVRSDQGPGTVLVAYLPSAGP